MIHSLSILDVEPNDNLKSLKQKIMIKETLISSDIDKIYFAGNMPNDKKISECGITNKSTIHIEKDIKIVVNTDIDNNNNTSSPFAYSNYNSIEINQQKNKKKKNGSKILQMTDLSKKQNDSDPLIDKSNDFDTSQQTECCIIL